MNYARTPDQLEKVASKFWPLELSEMEAKLSIVPLLLKTQDQFISALNLANDLNSLYLIVERSNLPPNVFLKHLVVLADFGGEMLKRISNEASLIFPNRELHYLWNGRPQTYKFKIFPEKKFSNANLGIDGKKLIKKHPFNDLQKDAIALLLFGSNYSDDHREAAMALSKCEIGEYLGKPAELSEYIKQKYIWVSRIIAGTKANSLGQLAQRFVAEYISKRFGPSVKVQPGGRLPNVSHTKSKIGTSFDIVINKGSKYVAIEVCFQVTTNSVIERKAGQAQARYEQIEIAGYKIAYVIDGAGNIERDTALKTICSYSHCTVAFSKEELNLLCEFIEANI